MAENIIFQINENGDCVSDLWTGDFCGNFSQDAIWLQIEDKDGNPVSLSRGDRIHFNHYDMELNKDYIIKEGYPGTYRVE